MRASLACCLVMLVVGSACERCKPTAPRDGPEVSLRSPELIERTRRFMGTVFRISVYARASRRTEASIERAFSEIGRLEGIVSEWQPHSEISEVNEAAGMHPVTVSAEAFAVVDAGLEVSRWSRGAFDLSWAAIWGLYDFSRGRRPAPSELKAHLPYVDWTSIELARAKRQVFLKRSGMKLGTGAIGKGAALDRAARLLAETGLDNFMLFAGGQVQVRGRRAGRPWRIGIQHPRERAMVAYLELTQGSVSTSGDYEHAFIDDQGVRWHHILDPATGLPARKSLSVTLVTTEGMYADALSTAAFILGPREAAAMLDRVPFDVSAVIVDPDLTVHVSPALQDRLVFTRSMKRVPLE